jgi:Flp pilus assembly protein TadG
MATELERAPCRRLRLLRRHIEQFLVGTRASVTATFALTLVPTLGFVGAAVDYSRANSSRAAMQSAVDATALMISKSAASMSQSQLTTYANDYFKALFNRTDVTGVTVTPTYSNDAGSQVIIKATGTVKAEFMRVMGITSIDIAASSTVRWGNKRLRIALVLDNTGSMSNSGKMTALQNATKGLLSQLQSAATNVGDVYVSIIPFAKDVNVGASNYNAEWIDWTAWDNSNGNCTNYSSSYKPKTKSSCLNNNGTWTTNAHSSWNGCVEDRGNSNGPSSGNYDTNVVPPNPTVTASLFPAEQASSCPEPVMALSYNWSAMNLLVNNMSPGGNTNQGIGLVWGWLSLVGGGPFPAPPAMSPNYQYQQVIILLTDGLNTENRWYNNQSSIDARQQITCNNVKAAGITVYTVQVNTGGDPVSTLLQNCASGSDKFFLLTSADQMVATFNQIGTALSNLRVAQ